MRNRVVIENVKPEINGGSFFIKRVINENVAVTADIFADGQDTLRASLWYKHEDDADWTEVSMHDHPNDVWTAAFVVEKKGFYTYKLEAWVDHLATWLQGFRRKYEVEEQITLDVQIGARLLRKTATLHGDDAAKKLLDAAISLEEDTHDHAIEMVLSDDFKQLVHDFPMKQFPTVYEKNLQVRVGREKELFSAWYQLFPRSASQEPDTHGTFKDVERLLPRLQELGFDVLHLPPIHPIGETNRRGKNNLEEVRPEEPGLPWAIGNQHGGHKDIHPELGTLADFKQLLREASLHGIEIAMDLAFQCSPDHPYIKEHPDWFSWLPNDEVAFAENPPNSYRDIIPFNFETDDWQHLWEELKSIVTYWCEVGVRIFRMDSPQEKPFKFWEWLIAEVHQQYPDAIFLSAAFTRTTVMNRLAKVGFSQSHTYFTWRTTRKELEAYVKELTQTDLREYMRPNFWPNTPDILPYELWGADSNAFALRYVLAATLSSNYGLYGPAFEFLENTGNKATGKDEYVNAEKFEIRQYDWAARNRITDLYTAVNRIRRNNLALQSTWNIHFTRTDNDLLMSYIKLTHDLSNIIWCIANFDTQYEQSGYVEVPKKLLKLDGRVNLKVTDLLTEEPYYWFEDWNYVKLKPSQNPIHIFRVEKGNQTH